MTIIQILKLLSLLTAGIFLILFPVTIRLRRRIPKHLLKQSKNAFPAEQKPIKESKQKKEKKKPKEKLQVKTKPQPRKDAPAKKAPSLETEVPLPSLFETLLMDDVDEPLPEIPVKAKPASTSKAKAPAVQEVPAVLEKAAEPPAPKPIQTEKPNPILQEAPQKGEVQKQETKPVVQAPVIAEPAAQEPVTPESVTQEPEVKPVQEEQPKALPKLKQVAEFTVPSDVQQKLDRFFGEDRLYPGWSWSEQEEQAS